jgi:cytochrome c peroxidase
MRRSLTGLLLLLALLVGSRPEQASGQQQVDRGLVKVELGKKLFFDPRLSSDNSTSCATCHNPKRGWADGLMVAEGMAQKIRGPRNTPTIVNAAYQELQFWDQRANSLRDQALQPLTNKIEMGFDFRAQAVDRIARIPGYQQLFMYAFGRPVNEQDMGDAIEAFERTIISTDAPVDKYMAGDLTALSEAGKRGYQIFSAAQCVRCHQPPMFRDGKVHNTGVAFRFNTGDQGRAKVDPTDGANIRAFKTPTLREVGRTAPYTHAGRLLDLRAVVDHYRRGGRRDDGTVDNRIDPLIGRGIQMSEQQARDLTQFLFEGFLGSTYPDLKPPELP